MGTLRARFSSVVFGISRISYRQNAYDLCCDLDQSCYVCMPHCFCQTSCSESRKHNLDRSPAAHRHHGTDRGNRRILTNSRRGLAVCHRTVRSWKACKCSRSKTTAPVSTRSEPHETRPRRVTTKRRSCYDRWTALSVRRFAAPQI